MVWCDVPLLRRQHHTDLFFLNVELVLSCECCWIQNNRQKSIKSTFTLTDVHFAEMANAITSGSDGNPVINKTSKTETMNCSFFPFPEYDLKHMQTPKTINEPNRRYKHTPTCTYCSGERIQVTTNRLFLWILAGLEIEKKKNAPRKRLKHWRVAESYRHRCNICPFNLCMWFI